MFKKKYTQICILTKTQLKLMRAYSRIYLDICINKVNQQDNNGL